MLHLQAYLVKEHVGIMKLTDTYDIFDAQTGEQVGVAKEEPGSLVKYLRLLVNKKLMPTTVNVYDQENDGLVLSIHRGVAFLRTKVTVRDGHGHTVGHFKSKLFSIGGGFWVYDENDKQFAEIKGDWKGWNFKFLTVDGEELGTVSKKWAGAMKELFTSADNYVIALNENVEQKEGGNLLLLAAGLAIDTVFKERE